MKCRRSVFSMQFILSIWFINASTLPHNWIPLWIMHKLSRSRYFWIFAVAYVNGFAILLARRGESNSRGRLETKQVIFFLFFDLRGCLGQLARTTTNPTTHWTPCKPSEHVRHRRGDRHAHEDSNPEAAGGDKPLLLPGQDPRCYLFNFTMRCRCCLIWFSYHVSVIEFMRYLIIKIIFIWKYIKVVFF